MGNTGIRRLLHATLLCGDKHGDAEQVSFEACLCM